ncbi:hypothetical protein ACQP1W_44490 [Spirillospora sp. CA-255316]
MLPRSTGKPVFIGLGTAAILAVGAAQVQAAAPGEPAVPALEVVIDAPEQGKAGTPVELRATVKAVNGDAEAVKVTSLTAVAEPATDVDFKGACVPSCDLTPKLAATATEPIPLTSVTVPDSIKKTTKVTVTFTVDSTTTEEKVATRTVTYTPVSTPTPTPTKTSKPTPTKTPKPSPTPTKSSDKDDDDDDNSGGSSGSSGSGSGSGSSYTPPTPNGSFNTPSAPASPQVALPPIAPPSPSVAPQTAPTPESRLRNNKAPVAQDLTFERMASTQVAWLAALLVAFSLLMTQLRLGRRRPVPVSARTARATGRSKGHHRRPRRGLFGK